MVQAKKKYIERVSETQKTVSVQWASVFNNAVTTRWAFAWKGIYEVSVIMYISQSQGLLRYHCVDIWMIITKFDCVWKNLSDTCLVTGIKACKNDWQTISNQSNRKTSEKHIREGLRTEINKILDNLQAFRGGGDCWLHMILKSELSSAITPRYFTSEEKQNQYSSELE